MSSDVIHYGVKGMHWGVRKNTPTNANYGVSQRQYDKKNHGRAGVKRINRRLNKGMPLDKARKAESSFKARRGLAIGTALTFGPQILEGARVAGTILNMFAGAAASSVAKKAETNRGRAEAASIRGLPRNATNGPTYANKNRGGAYNISSI